MTAPRFRFQTIAVLGAGTMGAQMAGHFANAGCAVHLLDVTGEAARQGLDRARRLRPDPFFTTDTVERIHPAGLDVDLDRIAAADWIVEAVIEQLEIKRAVLERVDLARRAGTIVSSNTSGLSIEQLAAGRSHDFRRHWLGTHFFNPPRYLPLLEVVPCTDTDPAVVSAVTEAGASLLGKHVILARDTPGFIANHVGVFALARVLELLDHGDYSIEEIDAMTGAAIGRPKSATFRTIDIAGLDVLAAVAADLAQRLPPERARQFTLPSFVHDMIRRGWTGEKAGRGFYERRRTADGEPEIWVLDPRRMEYTPRTPAALPALDAARDFSLPQRMRALYTGSDKVGHFFRTTLQPLFEYVQSVATDIAHSPDDIDRAMQWGYGWPLGPFEIANAVAHAGAPMVSTRDRQPSVASTRGCSLIDSGDGVLTAILHSKMNAIGPDELAMLRRGLDEAQRNFAALVIAAEGTHFSAGANLRLLLHAARDKQWLEIAELIRSFQDLTLNLRYAAVPVVVAPFGLTLGGGCEIALHGSIVHAAAETYMGLVETRVGLLPAGGGTKEMLVRVGARRAFEIIGLAQTSTSAPDARRLGYLRPSDGWTMRGDRVAEDARQRALEHVRKGFIPPARGQTVRVGGESQRAALDLTAHLAWRAGRISEYDVSIARHVSRVLTGGLPHAGSVSEDRLLELEREAFLSLCGEPKTQERIEYTLETGKVLRN